MRAYDLHITFGCVKPQKGVFDCIYFFFFFGGGGCLVSEGLG